MPNAQLAPPPMDMDLDDTTFVTLHTAFSRIHTPNESPVTERLSNVPSIQTPGGVRLPHTQGQDADDEHSDSPAVMSPSFSGFHSAQSSPGTRLQFYAAIEENNLDGHTLIGEPPSVLVDHSHQDMSALSFLSVNQSITNTRSQSLSQSQEQDRQVVDEPQLAPPGANGSAPDSLLSQVHYTDGRSSAKSKSSPVRSVVAASPDAPKNSEGRPPKSWEDIMRMLQSGQPSQENTDQDKDEPDDDPSNDPDDQDSLLHSEQSLPFPPRSSPLGTSSRSSRKPPPSAQQDLPSQKSQLTTENSPATSTRSKHAIRASDSQPNLSQASEIVDLTSPPESISQPTESSLRDVSGWVSKAGADDDTTAGPSSQQSRMPSEKMQRMSEVSVSSQTKPKRSKKRLSRKF